MADIVDVKNLTFVIDEAESLDFTLDEAESLDFELDEYTQVTPDKYQGPYYVIPEVEPQLLETKNKLMSDDVTVWAIPYTEVSNPEGTTVIIG